ncbi:unnamed protein product [Timema podura]|uniref:Uncharacterized protein n=1 Tax=Timema podura TaxID=61482 RepID=A0ABN7NE81_TIMPD|nr:unnamed protein product [Timema podura]
MITPHTAAIGQKGCLFKKINRYHPISRPSAVFTKPSPHVLLVIKPALVATWSKGVTLAIDWIAIAWEIRIRISTTALKGVRDWWMV